MFYNVENLFDTTDDTLKNDDEFLPKSERFWDDYKYYTKLQHIYKVIIAIGQWDPPAFIGLSEIENKKVLTDLVNNTPLVKFQYKIIHEESPDRRGIDVGFIYRSNYFSPLNHKAIPINFPGDSSIKTRDILYVKGVLMALDTLHVFINHWPSRWGGQLESEGRRIYVASVLKSKTDSILNATPNANIIITGDFNDYPYNKSILEILHANTEINQVKPSELYNLTSKLNVSTNQGSHKYQGEWGMLDQFIVSGSLLTKSNKIHTSPDNVFIFDADFLLEPDENYYGFKPYRTYIGYKYHGGYSDHLPVYLILNY